jgi:hypothetical protein
MQMQRENSEKQQNPYPNQVAVTNRDLRKQKREQSDNSVWKLSSNEGMLLYPSLRKRHTKTSTNVTDRAGDLYRRHSGTWPQSSRASRRLVANGQT